MPSRTTVCSLFLLLALVAGVPCQTVPSACLNNKCDPLHGSCADVFGSVTFACSCSKGYRLSASSNWTTCTDINECALGYCSNGCKNTPGSYMCSCPAGFTLDSDNRTCIDVNECGNASACQPQEICINSVGGFVCMADLANTSESTSALGLAISPSGLQKLFTDEYFIVMLAFHLLATALSLVVAFILLQRSKARLQIEAARKRRFYESQQNTLTTLRSL